MRSDTADDRQRPGPGCGSPDPAAPALPVSTRSGGEGLMERRRRAEKAFLVLAHSHDQHSSYLAQSTFERAVNRQCAEENPGGHKPSPGIGDPGAVPEAARSDLVPSAFGREPRLRADPTNALVRKCVRQCPARSSAAPTVPRSSLNAWFHSLRLKPGMNHSMHNGSMAGAASAVPKSAVSQRN